MYDLERNQKLTHFPDFCRAVRDQFWEPGSRCASQGCNCLLEERDHIVMVTTGHARRFCSVECITAGYTELLEYHVRGQFETEEEDENT